MTTAPRFLGDFLVTTAGTLPTATTQATERAASDWFRVHSDHRTPVALSVVVAVTSVPAGKSITFTLQGDPDIAAGFESTSPLPDVAGPVLATSSAVTSAPTTVTLAASATPDQCRGFFRLAWTLSGFAASDSAEFTATVTP